MRLFFQRAGVTLSLVFCALTSSACELSAGANGIEITTTEAYPTFECIGLRLKYEGDSNSNASAGVRYRLKGQAGWKPALPLERIGVDRFAGSIFFLLSGMAYEVELTVSDPDAPEARVKILNVSTRSDRFPQGAGKQYFVSPDAATDGSGTLLKPFRTIQRAAALTRPGDIVWLMPGLYRETVQVNVSGTPQAYITFKALGKGVILSGADPRYEETSEARAWQAEGNGAVYCTDPGYTTSYVAAGGERLFHYLSREEFDQFICGAPGGWYQEKESRRLFLRLTSGRDPNSLPVQVARCDEGFHLKNASYIAIEGMEIRDFGRETPGAGVHLEKSAWNVIRDCSIHGMNAGVLLTAPESEGNLVENCELWDSSIPAWPWWMTKGRDEEGAGVVSYTGGRGNVVRSCRFHTLFDGLSPANFEGSSSESYNCDWDVYDNEISDTRDDVIEPEGPCINFRFWNNRCRDMFSGVSLAPINTGPAYVMYNVLYGHMYLGLKYNGIGEGICNIFHNTVYTSVSGIDAIRSADRITGQHFRNNIFFGDGLALNAIEGVSSDNDWDYDLWYNLDVQWMKSYTAESSRRRLFKLASKLVNSLSQFQELTGWEQHGLYVDPLFADPVNGDLRLRPESPGVDRGVVLPNINDGFKGKAPDMGAYEWGSSVRDRFPLGNPLYSR